MLSRHQCENICCINTGDTLIHYRTLFSVILKWSWKRLPHRILHIERAPPVKEPTRRDHLRRSRAIRQALPPGSPASSLGNFARHLYTLAVLISGIVGRKRPPLPPIATQVPEGTKPARRVKRCARWCANAPILEEGSLPPAAAVVLRPRALETVVRVMDGRGVGRWGYRPADPCPR